VGVKVGIGNGVEVAVGVGGTIGVAEAADAAEVASTFVARGEGAGCDVQALKRMRGRVNERKKAFMHAIMAETGSGVNAANTGARSNARPCCAVGLEL
jgi:hypothetical protein